MRSSTTYHLTSAHRNRQCYAQTGLLISADGSDSPNPQYTSSQAYRVATTLSDGDTAYSHSHVSCPVAVSVVRGPLVPDGHGAYIGQWGLCSDMVANLLPTDYPSLDGYYAMVALGEHRVPFRLLPGANTRVFHATPATGWISTIPGVSSLLNDAESWFPSQPATTARLQEIIAEHDGPNAQHACHVVRAPPAILLEHGAENVHMEWSTTDATLLHLSVKNHTGVSSLQYLADLLVHADQQPILLHIGGTQGSLDEAGVCSSNIYGVDQVTGPDYVAFYVTARPAGALTGAQVPTAVGSDGLVGQWGPLTGSNAYYGGQAVLMRGALTAPRFRGTLIGQLVVLRFTLTAWVAGDVILSYSDGDDIWSLAWGYPDGVVGSTHTSLELWITLPQGGVARPLLLQSGLLNHASPFLSNTQLTNRPCDVTLALLVHPRTGMVDWMWSGYDVVGGVPHASTSLTTPVSVHGTDRLIGTGEIRSQGYSGLVMGKQHEGVAYHDIRVYASSKDVVMATEHEWMRTQAGGGGGYLGVDLGVDLVSAPPDTLRTSQTCGCEQWQLVLRLGGPSTPPAVPLPHTAYIEGWSAVQTPTYGPGFALNRIASVRSGLPRLSAQAVEVTIDVRLMYVTLPAMATMRISKRSLLHIPAWWIAVRLSEPLMQMYIDDSAATISLRPSNPSITYPSWVSSRGTLIFHAQLDKYTPGVTVALQLACPASSARLLLQSTALQRAAIGLPRVCIFASDGEVLDLVPLIGGEDIPIEGGPALPDDIAYVGLQVDITS